MKVLNRFTSMIAFAAIAAAPLLQAQQQQPQPTFGEQIEVNTVLIDAVVTDARGNQMLGLTKDDFIVRENGVEQTIDSVDYFTNRRLLNANEKNAGFHVDRTHEARYFVLFFDKHVGSSFFDRVTQARRAAQRFVDEQMLPNDMVAVVGHDVRLKVFSDFTSDKKQLSRALEDASTFSRGLPAERTAKSDAPSILASVDTSKMMQRSGTAYEALTVLADALRPIRGRKNLVLFSPGIMEPSEDVRGGVLLNRSRYYDPMVESLNAANVTVYPVQLLEDPPSAPALHETLERVAHDTNGEYYRYTTNFMQPLKRIEQSTSGYYLIAYRGNHPRGAHGFQHVDVSLKNPEFRVKAREGYVYGSE